MGMKEKRNFVVYTIVLGLVFLILMILYGFFKDAVSSNQDMTTAKKGVLDLSEWDIEAQPILSLGGEWGFHYDRFINPKDTYIPSQEHLQVPGLWNSFSINGTAIGPHGYGTYQLRVFLPEGHDNKLALKIPDMSSCYQLFINGREVSRNGITGKSFDEETPSWKQRVTTIGNLAGQVDIVAHVSNYHHMKGGMWEPILIGTEEAIFRNREQNMMVSILLVGVLFISVLYYLVIFSVVQKNYASLYLALFCLAASTREFLIREAIVYLLFPNVPFGLLSKLEYLTVPSGPLLLALSLYALYPEVFPKRAMKILVAPFLFYMAIIVVTPLNFFGHFMNVYLILFIAAFLYLFMVLVLAARKNKPGARLLLVGSIIMLVTAMIDMGYANMIHYNYSMAYTFSIGFVIFILCQMHSLSLLIADMVEKSKNLSKAEMAFLQAQIIPHFLHNTLNTVIHLTRESPEKARDLLLKLSEYLRGKFNFDMYKQNTLVPFKYELDLVKSYLSIEMARFSDRLLVVYNIDEKAFTFKIIPFILQPLVENAIRHGLKNKVQGLNITISALCQQDQLVIIVEDNGRGMAKEKILSVINGEAVETGTGLYNVNKRVKTAYGEGLDIQSTINEGTTIKIKVSANRKKHKGV